MFFRLLAINVDGTLLTKNGRIHKSTREAISEVQQKGVKITLITQRSFSSAKRIADALNITIPIVAHQGAFVASSAQNPIFVRRIGEEKTSDVIRFLEGFPCQIQLVQEDKILANRHKSNRSFLGNAVFSLGEPIVHSQQVVKSLSTAIQENPINPLNIAVRFDKKNDVEDVISAIKGMFTQLTITQTAERTLQITRKQVSKLSGLMLLGEQFHISKQEMVVIGDALDDIPMIESAGLGVAMGNADPLVKRAADWVTRSNAEHGVAYMVREHFRKQQRFEFLRKINIKK